MALRRSHFQCGKCEGRRSQSSVARTQCHLVRDALFPKVTVYGKKRLYTVTFFIMQRRCAHEFSVYL